MNAHKKLTDLREALVYDRFCSEETCNPSLGKRVYDLCSAANITTVGQLADMTAEQLRSKSFPDDLIPYICLELQNDHPQLNLVHNFSASTGAQGRVAVRSCLPLEGGYGVNGIKYGA